PCLQPVKAASVNDDTAALVADPDPITVSELQFGQGFGMDESGRPALAGNAGRRIIEARVKERARRCCNQPERPLGITLVDYSDMVGESRQLRVLGPDRPPVGAEVELPVRMSETIEKMRGLERRTAIKPALFREILDPGQPAHFQGLVDDLDRTH